MPQWWFGLLVAGQLPSLNCMEKTELPKQFLKLVLENRWCVPKPVLCPAVRNKHPWEDILKGGDCTASLRPGTSELISMLLWASCVSWDLAQMPARPGIQDRLSQGRIWTRPWLPTQSSQRIRCSLRPSPCALRTASSFLWLSIRIKLWQP